ncbi:MAG: DUF4167 domain-containing protein [Pseudomonadota bacterium]
MRDFKGMKRQRGRNRNKAGANNANNANPNRSWDSQGPENIKVRGNAQTVYERYQQLARDAASSGDRVLAENYQQHAEHYYRVLRALQPQRSFSDIAAREQSNQGFDIDFEDESGAQAAAFVAAQQAADRQAAEAAERAEQNQNQNRDRDYNRDRDRDRDNRDRDNRDRDRDQNRDRDRDQNRDGQQPREPREGDEVRAEGEGGGRRESRRERWERRREERNRRFDNQDGAQDGAEGAAPAYAEADRAEAVSEAPAAEAPVPETPSVEATAADERPARRPRRTAAAVAADEGDAPTALPGFLTRAPVSSAPAEQAEGEAAPRRRAPRRKPEAAAASED